MHGTAGLELTSLINSDLTWKKVAKGDRSSSRWAMNSVSRSLETVENLISKDSNAVDMPVSESEKLGVTVLGCCLSGKAEHVPIKKRKFMFRLSPPLTTASSPHREESERLLKSQLDAIDCGASASDSGQILHTEHDADQKNLTRVNRQHDENEDFSGISILAAAACANSFGGGDDHVEDGSRVEESFAHYGSSMNNKLNSLSKRVSKEDLSSADISTEGAGSCISAVLPEELAVLSGGDNSSAISVLQANNAHDKCMQDQSVAVSEVLLTAKDEGTNQVQGSSLRDDRLHWDLNTYMDTWECPYDYQCADSCTKVADGHSEDVKCGSCIDKIGSSETLVDGHPENVTCVDCRDKIGISEAVADGQPEALKPRDSSDKMRSSEGVAGGHFEDLNCGDSGDKMGNSESEAVQREPEGSRAHVETELLVDEPTAIDHDEQLSNAEELKLDSCTATERVSCLPEKLSSSSSGCVGFVSADIASASTDGDRIAATQCFIIGSTGNSECVCSHQVAGFDLCLDNPLPNKTNHSMSTSISEAICDGASTGVTLLKNDGGCAAGTGKIIFSGLQVKKDEVAFPVPLSGNTASKTQAALNEDTESANEITHLHDNSTTPESSQPLKSEPADDVRENSLCQLDKVAFSPSSAIGIEMLASGALAMVQLENDLWHDTTKIKNEVHRESKEPVRESPENAMASLHASLDFGSCDACRNNSEDLVNSSDKKAVEEPFNNGYDASVSHDGHANKKVSSFEVDYDSQYEDGEVRESIELTWEEYDGEDIETEHGDHESEIVNLDSADAQFMIIGQGSDCQPCLHSLKGNDASSEAETGDNSGNKPEPGLGKVIRNCGSGVGMDDMMTGTRNGGIWKNVNGDVVDGLDGKDHTKITETRACRRVLRSCIEGQASLDVSFRKDSDADDSNARYESDSGQVESFGRGRYTRCSHNRGRGVDHWVNSRDSNKGIRHHHSPSCHGSMSFHHPGRENGVHWRLTRSGSPDGRHEICGMRMHIGSSGDFSPGRCVTLGRGRSIRYRQQVDGRWPRGRYHGLVPDDYTESSLDHLRPRVRRDRSFSPIKRRRNLCVHQPHSKSPSSSRSRSPNAGNPCFRCRSKSPNFRSKHRMQRVRSPHQRPGVLADRVGGLRPMPRSHGSRTHTARWMCDRKDGVVHFREQGHNQRSSFLDKRLPGRFGPHSDRFDLVDSPRGFRLLHPGRFTEMDGVRRGGLRYEAHHDDRGKQGYRYGLVHRVKQYDMDGSVKPLHYKDGYVVAHNSRYRGDPDFHDRGSPKDHGRGTDNRIGDMPRKFREDRGPFLFQREEKYDIDSKSFGARGGDDDVASSKKPS